VPDKKSWKTSSREHFCSYGLEYGHDVLEIHKDAVVSGAKVLLIDDVLATGGTISAAIDLIHRIGGEVVHVLALLEISGLSGREKISKSYPHIPITSLVIS
jgi:adenine phosphoribosyltransferase